MNEFGEGRSPFPRIHLERTNALDLFINFMLRNQPCIICASATAKWKSRQQWIKVVDGKSVIDVEFFTKQYGHMEVPLVKQNTGGTEKSEKYSCCEGFDAYEKCGACRKVRLVDYISDLQKRPRPKDIGYAKDWHFQQESGTFYEMYGLPSFLYFDWINNEQWSGDERNVLGDYRFVYFGAQDTWTPFHVDVMSSYSWSANICGRKLWYFVPPGNEECFRIDRDTFLEDIRTQQFQWPSANVQSFVQEEGEIVFVPSNWYHQVHNLEDTVSINHNFVNASNVDLVAGLIFKRLKDVDRELADCKSCFSSTEYNMYCEQILAADIRVNLTQLSSLLRLIIDDRAKDVAECWVCPKHGQILDCKEDDDCLEFVLSTVRKNCNCQDQENDGICTSCLNFMKRFEVTVATECLSRICYVKEGRR